MLRFVIALGSNSVPGGWLEREISKFYSLDEFDILSMPVQAELQPKR